ncbi:stage V sporulation protein B [Vallitalea longa]|uniref:Stage V sporulation protein B n=1 Tax=Vallitalea longa TaxID=2936439 RepID=A0A9W5YIV9_9FIRM|nr:polysaccharide biosynthesis protein [Vallitalea longa]GKX32143.1 stage V sporulation protein B [Vallitalea longa]
MTTQTKTFVKGAMILSIAGLIAKIFSALYRIPLAYLVGTEGIGYYTTVYPLYSILVSASLVGIPNALSKLTSEKIAEEDYYNAHYIYKYSLILISIFGAFISLIMVLGVDQIIKLGDWPNEVRYVIYGLAVSPIFISITGAFKGYFQGMQIMVPTALTQIIENITKVILGIGITYFLINMNYSITMSVGGAALGTSLGFLVSTVFIILYYLRRRYRINEKIDFSSHKRHIAFNAVAKKLIVIAIPITIVSAAYSIMNLIDSSTIYKRLGAISIDKLQAVDMYGQMGNAFTIINVPLTISLALMISIVPAVSIAVTKKNLEDLVAKIKLAIRFALLLALPAAIGLFLLAKPIMELLYPTSAGYEYLRLYSICLIFIILGQALAGILQGMGKYYFPLISLAVSIVIKVIMNYVLVASELQLKGAIIGSICYYIIYVLLNYLMIKKETKLKLNVIKIIIKPLISTGIMGLSVWLIYNGMIELVNSNTIATLLSIICGIIVYVIMLIVTRTLQEEDFAFIPNNEKIVKRLKNMKLIK